MWVQQHHFGSNAYRAGSENGDKEPGDQDEN